MILPTELVSWHLLTKNLINRNSIQFKMIIDFDDSLYSDTVSGVNLAKWCNKKFKPTAYDLSYDTSISENDVWFIKRDFLPEFFSILPRECPKITVVTQHSDFELDDVVMTVKPTCVVKVFSPNNVCTLPSSVPIPLGLGPPFGRGAPLAEDISKVDTRKERNKLLYVNFRYQTYQSERKPLWDMFQKENYKWVTIGSIDTNYDVFGTYLNSLVQHKFSLCPRGNGIDTHRLWESLYCRTIPIVKRHIANRTFEDLPILFVDDWSQITEDFLHNEYERMKTIKWNYSKLSASWWGKQFRN